MKSQLAFILSSKQRIAFLIIALILLLSVVYLNFFYEEKPPEFTKVEFSEMETVEEILNLKKFDPNELSEEEWVNLGFSEKQVATIIKYKDIVGGEFTSKAQLKKCYAISPEKYAQLESFILLPETAPSNKTFFANHYEKRTLKIQGKFNPDTKTQSDWMQMGFSEKQAAGIIKYKSYLGGSFISKEKFKECYMISDENYAKLSPYLILPNLTPADFNPYKKSFPSENVVTKINYQNFDPNDLDLNDWQKLGFSEKQAQGILNYKEKILRGRFKTLEEISKCYMISAEKFEELKPYIQLPQETNSTATFVNYKEDKPKETPDFSKIDLNKITFKQLQEFGFEDKAAGSFVGFRKKLGGFVSKTQIMETYNLDKNLTQKLLESAPLNNLDIDKYSLSDAPEAWLKSHPYFSYNADKIIFFRISEPDEKKIFKKLNLKPDQIDKMKLYLK